MGRFVKFLCQDTMIILNTEDICCVQFMTSSKMIIIAFISSEARNSFHFKTKEDFKIQCDEIMRQLEI